MTEEYFGVLSLKTSYGSLKKKPLKVSLSEKKVFYDNFAIEFSISDDIRDRLLNGYDDIELTLKKSDLIEKYERKISNKYKWKLINERK